MPGQRLMEVTWMAELTGIHGDSRGLGVVKPMIFVSHHTDHPVPQASIVIHKSTVKNDANTEPELYVH